MRIDTCCPRGTQSSRSISLIVFTPQVRPRRRSKCVFPRTSTHNNRPTVQKNTILTGVAGSEPQNMAARLPKPAVIRIIVARKNGPVGRPLASKENLLRGTIVLHRAVPVQMVGRETCQNSDVRTNSAVAQQLQLKTAQFQNQCVIDRHLRNAGQQAATDVSTKPDFSGSRRSTMDQHVMNQRCRG